MNFSTFGPFPIPMDVEHKGDELARIYKKVNLGLNDACGIYIFLDGTKNLPVYVGQAQHNTFGARIPDHLNGRTNLELGAFLKPEARLSLLLIALVAQGDLLETKLGIRLDQSGAKRDAVNRLEKMLISACRKANHELLNINSVNFDTETEDFHRETHVPGYLNTTAQDRLNFPAVATLEKVLQPKRTSNTARS